MTTITKEWLQQTIAEFENTRDDIPFGLSDDDAKILIVLKCALVSLDAEPVRYLNKFSGTCVTLEQQSNAADDVAVYMPLYAAPPVPVVPDERAAFNTWNNEDNLPIAGVGAKNAAWLAWQARASLCGNSALNVPPERPADSSNGDDVEAWFDEGWNACRAAMLKGKGE